MSPLKLSAALVSVLVIVSGVAVCVSACSFSVSYDANGGTGAPSSQTAGLDGNVTVTTSEPVMKDYRFAGWAYDRYAVTYDVLPGESIKVSQNTTLYAVYVPCGDLVVLTDPGLDDMVAVLEILHHSKMFDSITLIAVGGNKSPAESLNNLRKIVDIASEESDVSNVTVVYSIKMWSARSNFVSFL